MSSMMIIIVISAFGLGAVLSWLINTFIGRNSLNSAKIKSEQLLQDAKDEAENLKRDKLIEAEELIYENRQKLEEEFQSKKKSLQKLESELLVKENNIDRKADLISKKEKQINMQEKDVKNKEQQLNIRNEKLNQLIDEQNKKLEAISGLTREEAKNILMDNLIDSAKKEAAGQVYKILDDAKRDAQVKAKEVVITAIQQTATDHAVESTVSIVSLPNDDMKGRIIGREGRNIRAFETVTGIDVIVDDTPEAVILSGYDPYRRELARITMEKLVSDGRIHPGRIEETYEKTTKEMDEYFSELGNQAILETGIHSLHPELIKVLGKLRYRTSYGQNVLQHSKEVAIISGIMAAEMGLDESLAKRAGLLHDIGRGIESRGEGSHTQIGYDFAKRYGEHPIVLNAIQGHHGEVEAISPISVLVQVANDISKSRPGARREVIEKYISRMTRMENIAKEFEGVYNAYAIQAGKEVRVIIDHEKVDDASSHQLASDIALRIQKELDYPGQVKIVVIREFRSIDFA
ncbi:MAG: ribonuclease Y [Calditrichaceae bacterium]|nr:ribonuclease Y [Calditrichaceae bacterium]MBN2709867.1 ribonuclease Y [Calditrichaceae bacterium]RQV92624.1 MAG: ribonuclease Y [Calditrichota bacterium]